MIEILKAIFFGIVDGVTEWLPVSSTGHMIITQNLLGVESTEFVKAFTFIIQFGAILSVVVLYWKRFFQLNHTPAPESASALKRLLHKYDFYWKLLVAFIPAAVLGLLFSDMIDAMLESVTVVAITLILGGIFMLFCDKIFNKGNESTQLTEKRAFWIGMFQCISMIPGVSRSMATIVGGMVMAVLNNGLMLMGVGADKTQVIKGLVLLAAVAYDVYNKQRGRTSIIGKLFPSKEDSSKPVQ
jgi:undecaprenyl-diphosphatase